MLKNILIERIAKKYYRIYRKKLIRACISEEDLIQEAYYTVYHTIKHLKSKNLPTDIPLIIQGVIWHLNTFIRRVSFYNKLFISFVDLSQSLGFTQEELIDFLNIKKSIFNPQILITILKEQLTTKEFDLLRKKYIENKTFQEIGEEYGVSRQAIKEKTDRILKKVRKKIKKNVLLFSK